MSIKIYNGFRFIGNPSLLELTAITNQFLTETQNIANHEYGRMILKEIIRMVDIKACLGEEKLKQYLGKSYVSNASYELLAESKIYKNVTEAIQSSQRDVYYDLGASLHIIPIKDKVLALLYAENTELYRCFANSEHLVSYFYQNQTDKPEEISDEEWEQRRQDWMEAIPSGVPFDVGFDLKCINSLRFPATLYDILQENSDFEIPTELERAQWIVKNFYEYPPFNGRNFHVFSRPEFFKWVDEEAEKLVSKIIHIKELKELENFKTAN